MPEGSDAKPGRLLTIEEVGGIMNGWLLLLRATKYARLIRLQYPSISRTKMRSTSPSKSTCRL